MRWRAWRQWLPSPAPPPRSRYPRTPISWHAAHPRRPSPPRVRVRGPQAAGSQQAYRRLRPARSEPRKQPENSKQPQIRSSRESPPALILEGEPPCGARQPSAQAVEVRAAPNVLRAQKRGAPSQWSDGPGSQRWAGAGDLRSAGVGWLGLLWRAEPESKGVADPAAEAEPRCAPWVLAPAVPPALGARTRVGGCLCSIWDAFCLVSAREDRAIRLRIASPALVPLPEGGASRGGRMEATNHHHLAPPTDDRRETMIRAEASGGSRVEIAMCRLPKCTPARFVGAALVESHQTRARRVPPGNASPLHT